MNSHFYPNFRPPQGSRHSRSHPRSCSRRSSSLHPPSEGLKAHPGNFIPPWFRLNLINSSRQTWVKAHYEQAMLFVSFTEVILVFGRLLLGAITFQNSSVLPSIPPLPPADLDMKRRFLAPLFFAHFLRLRYYLSPPTRQAFAWVSSQVDSGIGHPSCPAPVKQVVNIVRDLVRSSPPYPFRSTDGTRADYPI